VYKELGIKNACCARFSRGGAFLALAAPKPKSTSYDVLVYQSYSLEKIATLKGHIQMVSELIFSENDLSLFSCG